MRKIGKRRELLIAEGHLLPQQAWPCSGFPLSLGPCGQGWVLMELEQTVGSAESHEPDFHQPGGLLSCATDAKSAFFLRMLVTQ